MKKYKNITIKKFEQPPFGTNSYLMTFEKTKEAILFDPSGDPEIILKTIKEESLSIKKIYLTHGHLDHWIGVKKIQTIFDCDVYLNEKDFHLVNSESGKMFGLFNLPIPKKIKKLNSEKIILPNKKELQILETPGHSPGHIVFIGESYVLCGDLIFKGSIGRMDLPGGDEKEMKISLKKILEKIPIDYDLLPGHGPITNLKTEIEYNVYLGKDWLEN